MPPNIYFRSQSELSRQAARPGYSRQLREFCFRVGIKLAGEVTVNLAQRLLTTPCRTAHVGELPADYQRDELKFAEERLVVYSVGSGPVVLFSHGWSGNAAQFKPLMSQVASAGYRAVALDHYAHGESDGTQSNFLLFIRALKLIRQYYAKNLTPVSAVVGHSVGGIASLHAFDPSQVPHFLISPVIGFYQRFYDCAANAGINDSIFDAAVMAMEAAHGLRFSNADEKAVLRNSKVRVHLLHSKRDRLVPLENSVNFQVRAPHLGLTVAEDGGHYSVLCQLATSAVLLSWLSGEEVRKSEINRYLDFALR